MSLKIIQMKQFFILIFSFLILNITKAQHQHNHKPDTTKKVVPSSNKKTVEKTNETDHSDHVHGTKKDTVKPKQNSDSHEGHDHGNMVDTTKPTPDAHS